MGAIRRDEQYRECTEFFNFYTAHNVKAMLSLCSATATFRYVPLGERGTGAVQQVASSLWQSYIDAFPDFSTKVIRMIKSERDVIVCETLKTGTQAKDIGNIQNKGRTIAVPHLFIFEFNRDVLIEKITAFWDNDTIYAQLGHTEAHDKEENTLGR